MIIRPAAWTHPPVIAQGEPGMLEQLFYRAPSIDVLHEEYAKKGRIDARAPVGAAREIRIEAPVGKVWELLVNVPALGTWDRAVHDVHLESTVAADAWFTWVNGRARIRSRFAVVDPGRELTWTGISTGARPWTGMCWKLPTTLRPASAPRSRWPGRCWCCFTTAPSCGPEWSSG